MEGISKKRLEEIAEDYPPDHRNHRMAKYLIATECRELNQWMTLDEFLKSGFEGHVWVYAVNGEILLGYFSKSEFTWALGELDRNKLTHVQPIHKPEPPR